MLKFEWDEHKNQLNIKKHGISFEEASSVFNDENALVLNDMKSTVMKKIDSY